MVATCNPVQFFLVDPETGKARRFYLDKARRDDDHPVLTLRPGLIGKRSLPLEAGGSLGLDFATFALAPDGGILVLNMVHPPGASGKGCNAPLHPFPSDPSLWIASDGPFQVPNARAPP